MKKGLIACLCIGIIAFIWHNSMQSAAMSDARSIAVMAFVRKVAVHLGWQHPAEITNHLVRKGAHVFEYFLLGKGLCLWSYFLAFFRHHRFLFTVALGVIIASIDEWIQLFSPGRGAQLQDVGIDTMGVILGYVCMCCIWWIIRKKDSHEI